MLSKIYVVLLAISLLLMGFFTWYSWSWLNSIGSPIDTVRGYQYHADLSWPTLWISAIVLLMLANSILWVTGRLWPMWTSLAYFQLFVILRAFWLDPALVSFKSSAGMTDSTFSVAPIMAAILILIAGAIVFFDQFLVLRMREKTYGPRSTEKISHIESEDEKPRSIEEPGS